MKSYYRVMLGRKSIHATECFASGFIGTDFDIDEDLSGKQIGRASCRERVYVLV